MRLIGKLGGKLGSRRSPESFRQKVNNFPEKVLCRNFAKKTVLVPHYSRSHPRKLEHFPVYYIDGYGFNILVEIPYRKCVNFMRNLRQFLMKKKIQINSGAKFCRVHQEGH